MNLYPATNAVNTNELAFGLYELEYQSPGSRGFHRYQIIVVPRNDVLHEFVRDMGPARKFKGRAQVRVPAAIKDEHTGRWELLHTVGELIDIADQWRNIPEEPYVAPDWTTAYHDSIEKQRRRRAGKQTFAVAK